MQQPTMNGLPKPADQIARGPHKYNEATRKYEEVSAVLSEYPRGMWHHEKREYAEAHSRAEQTEMESLGWKTKPYAEKVVAKENTLTPSVNLAELVLAQHLQIETMQKTLVEMEKKQSTTAPAIPEEVPRSKKG